MIIIIAGGLFLERPETFRVVPKLFGWHKSLCIFNKNTFQALKLGSYFAFPYIIKRAAFTVSGSLFQELLFGPDKLPVEFRETAPGAKKFFVFFKALLASGSVEATSANPLRLIPQKNFWGVSQG